MDGQVWRGCDCSKGADEERGVPISHLVSSETSFHSFHTDSGLGGSSRLVASVSTASFSIPEWRGCILHLVPDKCEWPGASGSVVHGVSTMDESRESLVQSCQPSYHLC